MDGNIVSDKYADSSHRLRLPGLEAGESSAFQLNVYEKLKIAKSLDAYSDNILSILGVLAKIPEEEQSASMKRLNKACLPALQEILSATPQRADLMYDTFEGVYRFAIRKVGPSFSYYPNGVVESWHKPAIQLKPWKPNASTEKECEKLIRTNEEDNKKREEKKIQQESRRPRKKNNGKRISWSSIKKHYPVVYYQLKEKTSNKKIEIKAGKATSLYKILKIKKDIQDKIDNSTIVHDKYKLYNDFIYKADSMMKQWSVDTGIDIGAFNYTGIENHDADKIIYALKEHIRSGNDSITLMFETLICEIPDLKDKRVVLSPWASSGPLEKIIKVAKKCSKEEMNYLLAINMFDEDDLKEIQV